MAAAVESISWTVGNNVKLRTAQGEEVSGQVFAYDQPSSLLVLKEVGAHSGVNNIRIIKTSGVQAVISDAKPDQPFDMELPAVDLERCRKREEKALQQAEFESSRVGEGVTKEAQAIFESLAKTMPCVWRGKTIIVLDSVSVEDPYTPDATHSDADHAATRDRVRMVLHRERERLGLPGN
ncbi:hypothetical protein HXX76_000896 [Chlamydomonas incerta]|uniref:AD domain-containing protein n=1 Tax=Chlamydomonas incerta TaxID=51695 RepID=A0A835WF64_CHLIN|nr:hypothetical protein HXX76_000896 [Chlamydomonas incerta]|eukprot:KAG2446308.1 hypothetical protein HXX76_000896 [Chlamydomonas incerta]